MGILDKINSDFKKAQIEKDEFMLGVLRLLLSEMHNKEIEKKAKGGDGSLDEKEVISVIRKEVNKRKDSVEMFKRGGRDDLASKEEREMNVLVNYLPAPISPEELGKIIDDILKTSSGRFGDVMKEVMERTDYRADGKIAAEMIKDKMNHGET